MKEKVVTLYVSDDGTEFTSRTKCEARDKEIKEEQEFNQKVNDFKKASLKEKTKTIRDLYNEWYQDNGIDDDDLIADEYSPRTPLDFVSLKKYGIIALRDDAVEFLFNYIDELEQEVKDTKRELSEVEQKFKKEKQKAKSKRAE